MMRSIMTSLPAGVLVLIVCSALNVPPVDGAPRLKPRDSFVVSRDRLAQHEPAFASFDGDIYAGHVPTPQRGGGDGELYFMMFDATQKTFDDALLIWLNGGPGCSSLAGGLFFEMGPVTVPLRPAGYMGSEKLAPLGPNEHAWTRASAVMYLEQPAGVGFSTGTAPESEDDVASDFYGFLQNFYDIFGDEFRSKRLYIVGESYAGMYVPSMAHKIYLSNNKKNADESRHVNLAGIGIGNGWMDSKVQGKAVIDYALWHGMIDPTTRDALHDQFQVCLQGGTPKPSPPFHKFNTPDECGMMGAVLSAAGADALSDGEWSGGPNTYDVTTWDNYPVLLGRNGTVDNFFNNPEIRKEIHAPINDWKWEQCIPGAGRRRLIEMDRMLMLDNDKPLSVVPYISDLLDGAGIDVLVYNGDRDMSCNSVGSETLLNEMAWSGQASWLDPHITKRGLWLVDGKVAGYARAHKGLEFVTVYNSGHLVPYNVPREVSCTESCTSSFGWLFCQMNDTSLGSSHTLSLSQCNIRHLI
jgi:carboxypeptidase C (cathepsin A)